MKHIIITLIMLVIIIVTLSIKLANNVPYMITHQDNSGYYHARHLENGSTVVFLLSDDAENDPIRAIGTLVQIKTDEMGEHPIVTKWEE